MSAHFFALADSMKLCVIRTQETTIKGSVWLDWSKPCCCFWVVSLCEQGNAGHVLCISHLVLLTMYHHTISTYLYRSIIISSSTALLLLLVMLGQTNNCPPCALTIYPRKHTFILSSIIIKTSLISQLTHHTHT